MFNIFCFKGDEDVASPEHALNAFHYYFSRSYFSRMKMAIGVPWKSHFSRILFSRKRR